MRPAVVITTAVEPRPPRINADPAQMHQVLLNLVANAADAIGEEGGKIEIGLETPGTELCARHPDLCARPYVALTVSDSGVGIDATTRLRIFDPFFTTKGLRGTGLGLSVVHGVVTAHGGRIDVQSAPGQGSRFTVLLPAVDKTVSIASAGAGDAGDRRPSLQEPAAAPRTSDGPGPVVIAARR
jgi:signal transduction histidine kinase